MLTLRIILRANTDRLAAVAIGTVLGVVLLAAAYRISENFDTRLVQF